MGVTIHFEGRVKGETAYSLLVDELREFATNHDWPAEEISQSNALLKRVRDEQNRDYSGPTFGLQLAPDPACDSLRFEFDKDYYVQEFVKTQFAGVPTHVAIIELFRRIQPFFESLKIEDEGEFWDTSDESTLERHINRCDEVLQEVLATNPKAKGPVRLPNGRIADYIS